MLAFNFDYYLPDTLKEATDVFDSVKKEGKAPLYYGGGTEIISMGRVHNITPDAVIDIKKIPECNIIGEDGQNLVFGAALTLDDISESGMFPLLGLAASRIADHTIQCKLTLGGNLAGTIIYHETLMPLLISDATILIQSPSGSRQVPIMDVLSSGKRLQQGELIVSVSVDKKYAAYPHAHIKKSKAEKIGYPLVSLCAMDCGGVMRCAASGVCAYPFRFRDISLNGKSSTIADEISSELPEPILDDLEGSADYREFVMKHTIKNIIDRFKNGGE